MEVVIGNYEVPKISTRRYMGHKVCMRCGVVFLSDMRGYPKWCFDCKPVIKKGYQKGYRRRRKFDERCCSK